MSQANVELVCEGIARWNEGLKPEVYDHRRPTVGLESWSLMEEYRHIARRIASEQDGPVLDWGCGLGQVTDLLQRANVDATAFDYQPPHEGWRRLAHFPHITAYLTSDPVRLPFDSGSFDAVLSCGTLEHVADPPGSLAEIRRVLRPGGRFYVYKLPNRFSYVEFAARRFGAYHHGQGPFDRLYDIRAARTLLERHGFRIDEIRRANMLPITKAARYLPPKALWAGNRLLERVPGLNMVATNIEVVATASPSVR
jgi:SAM-dependent methyltransferase